MQNLFSTYLQLGFQHILDPNGYDHIVFILALCALYTIWDWKKVAILVTAFTLGHSFTLALSIYDIFRLPATFIETMIPITILLTCVINLATPRKMSPLHRQLQYGIALIFGFVHGMGFSNFLRSTMLPNEGNIGQKLFAFNLGLECGQLIVVAIILGLSYLVCHYTQLNKWDWRVLLSGIAAGISLTLVL